MTEIGRNLLFRSFDSEQMVAVRVAIALPVASNELIAGGYSCEIRTHGPFARVERVYGDDSLQALALGIYSIVIFLRNLEDFGKLYYENGEYYTVDDDFSFFRPLGDVAKNIGIKQGDP